MRIQYGRVEWRKQKAETETAKVKWNLKAGNGHLTHTLCEGGLYPSFQECSEQEFLVHHIMMDIPLSWKV